MVVEVEVWHWTASGMALMPSQGTAYITKQDAERLLQEADAKRLAWAKQHWGGSMPEMKR